MLLWFNKAFLMENGSSEGHVISIKELRWGGGRGNKAFLAGNGVSEGHVYSRKELIFG